MAADALVPFIARTLAVLSSMRKNADYLSQSQEIIKRYKYSSMFPQNNSAPKVLTLNM